MNDQVAALAGGGGLVPCAEVVALPRLQRELLSQLADANASIRSIRNGGGASALVWAIGVSKVEDHIVHMVADGPSELELGRTQCLRIL